MSLELPIGPCDAAKLFRHFVSLGGDYMLVSLPGINTEKPFLQVDNYVFAGEYEDALGTCVIFEETSDQVDGDNTKPQLKYKCHTVKKLNMMRTFLTEKKEGDEGGGKVEWFQIKDDSVANWTSMICSIAREGEDPEDESPSEAEELEGAAEDSGHLDQSFELEKQDSEMDESTSHDVCPALEEEELEALTLADKAPAGDQETPAAMTEASETGR
ncbi:hypothetical protein FKM82_017703 [Ascaphus truei]